MKCEKCDKKATVHFTQLVDGQMKKMSFCESCAEAEGIGDLSNFGLAPELVKGTIPGEIAVPTGGRDECPVCGFTRQKFQQVGRFGCSNCYQVFSDELNSRLGSMHRGIAHKGRGPEGKRGEQLKERRLKELKAELERMVAGEQYEDAARVRDEIQKIEEGTVEAS